MVMVAAVVALGVACAVVLCGRAMLAAVSDGDRRDRECARGNCCNQDSSHL
jgi:hypothetical protein